MDLGSIFLKFKLIFSEADPLSSLDALLSLLLLGFIKEERAEDFSKTFFYK